MPLTQLRLDADTALDNPRIQNYFYLIYFLQNSQLCGVCQREIIYNYLTVRDLLDDPNRGIRDTLNALGLNGSNFGGLERPGLVVVDPCIHNVAQYYIEDVIDHAMLRGSTRDDMAWTRKEHPAKIQFAFGTVYGLDTYAAACRYYDEGHEEDQSAPFWSLFNNSARVLLSTSHQQHDCLCPHMRLLNYRWIAGISHGEFAQLVLEFAKSRMVPTLRHVFHRYVFLPGDDFEPGPPMQRAVTEHEVKYKMKVVQLMLTDLELFIKRDELQAELRYLRIFGDAMIAPLREEDFEIDLDLEGELNLP